MAKMRRKGMSVFGIKHLAETESGERVRGYEPVISSSASGAKRKFLGLFSGGDTETIVIGVKKLKGTKSQRAQAKDFQEYIRGY